MAGEFIDDIEYLAKIVFITFILLSFIIIYNQRYIEGLLLISICIQFILIWILIRKYKVTSEIREFTGSIEKKDNQKYIFLGVGILFFILGINLLFRGVAIVHHSIIVYDVIKEKYYSDLFYSIIMGSILFVVSILFIVVGSKSIKKNQAEPASPKNNTSKFSKIN